MKTYMVSDLYTFPPALGTADERTPAALTSGCSLINLSFLTVTQANVEWTVSG